MAGKDSADPICHACGQPILPGQSVAGLPDQMMHLSCWLDARQKARDQQRKPGARSST